MRLWIVFPRERPEGSESSERGKMFRRKIAALIIGALSMFGLAMTAAPSAHATFPDCLPRATGDGAQYAMFWDNDDCPVYYPSGIAITLQHPTGGNQTIAQSPDSNAILVWGTDGNLYIAKRDYPGAPWAPQWMSGTGGYGDGLQFHDNGHMCIVDVYYTPYWCSGVYASSSWIGFVVVIQNSGHVDVMSVNGYVGGWN